MYKTSFIGNLNAYLHLRNEIYYSNTVIKKLFDYSFEVIQYYFTSNLRIDIGSTQTVSKYTNDLDIWLNNSKNYISYNEPGFNQIKKKMYNYGYKYLIYLLIPKTGIYHGLPYIGYTHSLKRRIRNHILDSMKIEYNPGNLRYIIEAFRIVVNSELNSILDELVKHDPEVFIENLSDLYNWLVSNKGTKIAEIVYSFIRDGVIHNYFELNVIEFHRNRATALSREKFLSKNYKHKVNDIEKEGTIWPNGLNMVEGGGGGSQIDYTLPIEDYIGFVSVGMKHEAIISLLREIYHCNYPSSIFSEYISKYFGSFANLQKEVLKPVVELMIKDNHNFTLYEIASAVGYDDKTMGLKIKDWFDGSGFKDLKLLMNAGVLNWIN